MVEELQMRVLLGIFLVCLIPCTRCEMRFACPRPQTPNSRILDGPCGRGTSIPFETNYLEVSPGPFTIQIEETIIHRGTPIRIALMEWKKNTPPCILLDHIPHNDEANVVANPKCQLNSYPIGGCYSSTVYYTVEIPDVDCDQCVLQMINAATDLYADDQKPCEQKGPANNNCTTYYSCANIKIRPTPAGRGRTLASCINHQLTLKNKWPYTAAEKFTIELEPPFDSTNYIDLFERPDWSVHFDMSLSTANMTVRRGSVGIFEGAKPVRFFPRYEGTLKVLNVNEREKLKSGAYSVRITARFRNGTYSNFNFPIGSSTGMFQPNMYRDHSAPYSSGGMLFGKKFGGPVATFPEVNLPAGECQAPGVESYGAVLTFYKSVLPRAIVTFTINRDLMYVHLATSFELSRIVFSTKWNDTEGQPKAQNMGFNKGGTNGLFYHGAQFIGDELIKTGGRRPTEASVVVRKDNNLDAVYGDVHMGIKAVIKSELLTVGLALMTFPENSQSFNLFVMVSNSTSILTEGFTVSLLGPYESFVINRYVRAVPLDSYMSFYNVSVPIVDMEIPQFLWTGHLAFSVHDAALQKTYTGKFERLNDKLCAGSGNIACKAKITLSVDGGYVDRGLEYIGANGMAMIGVGTQQGLMDISISVRDLKSGDKVGPVEIRRNGEVYRNLPEFNFGNIPAEDSRVFGKALISVDKDLLELMHAGYLTLVVTVNNPNFRPSSILGRIPRKAYYTPGLSIAQRTSTTQPPPPPPSFTGKLEKIWEDEEDKDSSKLNAPNANGGANVVVSSCLCIVLFISALI